MVDSSYILPALVVFAVLCGLRARIDVYAAFVRGAKEGLAALLQMAPYLCAVLTAASLLESAGVMRALEGMLSPALDLLGIPQETASVLLLRPLSGSAALAAVRSVMENVGADSRAARFACVISGASETIFFTGALYMGAAPGRRAGKALPAALGAYLAGVMAAALMV